MIQGLLTSTVPCSGRPDLFAWGALVLIQSLDFVRMQVWVFESYMLAEDRDDLGSIHAFGLFRNEAALLEGREKLVFPCGHRRPILPKEPKA